MQDTPVFHSFSIKNIFCDKMELGHFRFHMKNSFKTLMELSSILKPRSKIIVVINIMELLLELTFNKDNKSLPFTLL